MEVMNKNLELMRSEEKKAILNTMKAIKNQTRGIFLNYASISDHGTEVIAECLKSNDIVTKLDLDSNKITCYGAIFIAKAMKINMSMVFLRLSSNKIGDKGVRELAEALETNKNL